jgi:hypothetical protein
MARHVWSVLCEKTELQEPSKSLSLHGVIEQLSAFPVPADDLIGRALLAFPMTLACAWARSNRDAPETAGQRVRLLGPDRRALDVWDEELDLSGLRNLCIHRTAFPGIRFAGLGSYEFEVASLSRGGEATVVARLPLELKGGPGPSAH